VPTFPIIRSLSTAAKFEQIFQAVELNVAARLNMPALILIYSAIDAASWMCAEEPDGSVQKYFTAWVHKYVLQPSRLGCSALDVWAARCGVVHSLSSSSRLTREGKAREIIYVARGGNRDILDRLEAIRNAKSRQEASEGKRKVAAAGDMKQNVVIEIDALFNALRDGVAAMLSDAELDSALGARIKERGSKVLTAMRNSEGAAFLNWASTIFEIADASERQLFDLSYKAAGCAQCGTAPARVFVRAIREDGSHIAHSEMCDSCADALGGDGLIRDFRKR
jgi:hypothetical protein